MPIDAQALRGYVCLGSGCLAVALIVLVTARIKQTERRRMRRARYTARALAGVPLEDLFISPYHQNGIGVDAQGTSIILVSGVNVRTLRAERLLGAEVRRDDHVVMQADRGSQIERAAIGGLLFGGAGAIIGASGAPSMGISHPHRVSLLVRTMDVGSPNHEVVFWKVAPSTSSSSLTARSSSVALREAEKWCSRVAQIMQGAAGAQTEI